MYYNVSGILYCGLRMYRICKDEDGIGDGGACVCMHMFLFIFVAPCSNYMCNVIRVIVWGIICTSCIYYLYVCMSV